MTPSREAIERYLAEVGATALAEGTFRSHDESPRAVFALCAMIRAGLEVVDAARAQETEFSPAFLSMADELERRLAEALPRE